MQDNQELPGQKTGNIDLNSDKVQENISQQPPAEEARISEMPPAVTPQPQTENMEVHHPHLPHIGKKRFKEYFLEFIMIFLAVSLSFLAENFREHYIEHQRANQYAILLIQDIKKNSIRVKYELERRRIMQGSFDTLKNLLINNQLDSNAQIVKHAVLLSEILPLATTTAAFEQMQNSGSLRYIKNTQLVSLLTDYFNTLIPLTQTDIAQEFQLVKDNNQKFLREHLNLMQIDSEDNLLTDHPDIYDWDKRSAIQMYNVIVNTNIWNQWIIEKDLLPIEQEGNALIAALQKEYDLVP
jgi:hypothetical protein